MTTPSVVIERSYWGPADTLGALWIVGHEAKAWHTLERPREYPGFLPPGLYDLTLGVHHSHHADGTTTESPCYHISNQGAQPLARGFEIHAANRALELRGCCAIGQNVMKDANADVHALLYSTAAHNEWMAAMGGAPKGRLEIR